MNYQILESLLYLYSKYICRLKTHHINYYKRFSYKMTYVRIKIQHVNYLQRRIKLDEKYYRYSIKKKKII